MNGKVIIMQENKESQWFGYKDVAPDEKTHLVRGVFDSVADQYDIMNDVMSGGIHRIWKDRLIRQIRPRPNEDYLDVAGGTGDIAFRIHQKTSGNANITVLDLNENMINAGRNRAIDRGWIDNFNWMTGNAETLPFEDNSFDIYTISFGLRNVTRIDTALKEAYRVLRPGGRFFCLEFSHVKNPFFAQAYKTYSKFIIPQMGQIIAKDRDSYQYLVESIERFPNQRELCSRIKDAGFDRAHHIDLTNGIAAIHQGWKI